MLHKSSMLLLLFFFLSIPFLLAQKLDYVQGEILIQFKEGVAPKKWSAPVVQGRNRASTLKVKRCIAEGFNIWSLSFDWRSINERELLTAIRQDENIAAAQFNHFTRLRSREPDDPLFTNQWHLNNTGQIEGGIPGLDLGMLEAWDLTTGGVTPAGDTIVICVIDNGLDTSHQDFKGNVWVNDNEIPGNGVDDDNNGYIDDYHGWNVAEQNDQIDAFNFHGTITAGIIGAKGNNGIGVTGVNWNVKLMIVVGGFGQALESRIVEAYAYCLQQRKLYNETNGEQGAFVVASNSSWGISRVQPADYPIWCSIYDTLGYAGVINIGATDNQNTNVDSIGDMPTSCGSDFLIAVTNVDAAGKKVDDAAFGLQSIDLGAYGEDIFTTDDGNSYGTDGGTSFAAPMVSGAVGLLYSADCPTFTSIYQDAPAEAALLAKEYILRGTDPEVTLSGKTLTGGRLNINNSLNLLLEECGTCPPLLQVRTLNLIDVRTDLSWIAGDAIQSVDLRWRLVGEEEWTVEAGVSSPFALENLTACSDYEYQFKVYCEEDTLDFADRTFNFRTDGCCEPPEEVNFAFVGFQDVLLNWNSVLAATSYNLRYREVETEEWSTTFAFSNSGALRQLSECTTYELQIQSVCGADGNSAFGESLLVTTRGCGACLEANYCIPRSLSAENAEAEWIAEVDINTLNNNSKGEGYADFTDTESTSLARGGSYPIKITQEYSGFPFDEFFKVWIDFNQNGLFESAETVAASSIGLDSTFIDTVSIPTDALLGSTRMRVVMKFNAEPSACVSELNFFGEVEDYCVTISDTVSLNQNLKLSADLQIFPNPSTGPIRVEVDALEALGNYQVQVFSVFGALIWENQFFQKNQGRQKHLINLSGYPPGIYLVNLQSGNRRISKKVILR